MHSESELNKVMKLENDSLLIHKLNTNHHGVYFCETKLDNPIKADPKHMLAFFVDIIPDEN